MKSAKCPTSHVEADGQLVDLFPYNPNAFRVATIEVFDGHHVPLDPDVLTCPTCHCYVARPYDPNLKFPRTQPPRKSELGLNRRHQRCHETR